MCQGLPMEAFGRISFSACCSPSSLGNLDIVSSSSLYLAATCTRVLRQSTGAFGRNSYVFLVKEDPDPEVDSPGAVRTRKSDIISTSSSCGGGYGGLAVDGAFFGVFAPFSRSSFWVEGLGFQNFSEP